MNPKPRSLTSFLIVPVGTCFSSFTGYTPVMNVGHREDRLISGTLFPVGRCGSTPRVWRRAVVPHCNTPARDPRSSPKYRRAVQREPTVADVVAARRVVDRHLPRAPLERSPLLSSYFDADIHLKIETFKPTRTFKVRGALNKIASLDGAARDRGVVAASAGSHAQGVAYAASALGAPATVVMPRGVSEMIVRVCRAYGAEVRLEGSVYDDTLALAHRIEREEGKTFVHPYADPLIISGQGTIGLEVLDDLADVELVVVAVGGGGLITGIALALRSALPAVRIVGVEPEGADAVGRSVRAGHPIVLKHPQSVADKLVAKSTEALNVELASRHVDEFVTVSDGELERASYEYLEALSLLVEPSGA